MGAIFDDEFRLRWYHALAWRGLLVLGAVDMVRHPMTVDVARSVLAVALMLLGMWYALADRSTDLVEGRRRLRVWYAIVTALYAAMTIAVRLALARRSLVSAVQPRQCGRTDGLDLPVRGAGLADFNQPAGARPGAGQGNRRALPNDTPSSAAQPEPTRRSSQRSAS